MTEEETMDAGALPYTDEELRQWGLDHGPETHSRYCDDRTSGGQCRTERWLATLAAAREPVAPAGAGADALARWLHREDHQGREWDDDMYGDDTLRAVVRIYTEKADRLEAAIRGTEAAPVAAAREPVAPAEATAGLAEAVASFAHTFAHGAQGPWEQPGGARHRERDTEQAQGFLAAIRAALSQPPALAAASREAAPVADVRTISGEAGNRPPPPPPPDTTAGRAAPVAAGLDRGRQHVGTDDELRRIGSLGRRDPEADEIVLTSDEADALREVLAMLSVIEDRGLRHDHVIEITRETWRDMLLRPAQRLRRIGQMQLEAPDGR